ncbi:hypothetical protein BX666DRAFT_2016963 [Dichotomocladium elegans]|nr:hypothetical protein BX666DRAFT_2016963 [Dichotomocladium elegans]
MQTSANSIPSELIAHILQYLVHPSDLLNAALTCKTWSGLATELLWYKPNFTRSSAWINFCNVIHETAPTVYPYPSFIRRINLSLLGGEVVDSNLAALGVCSRLERITLTNCSSLTDNGIIDFLGQNPRKYLVSIDLSDVINITDVSIKRIAEICPNLQGLNLSMCREGTDKFFGVTDDSIVLLAERCNSLRRIKLNNCIKITDASALALAKHCPALLEIDLMKSSVTDECLFAIFEHSRELREFRLNNCALITDAGFTKSALARAPAPSPTEHPFSTTLYLDQLRILDLTGNYAITDDAIKCVLAVAPKIRNLVLNKCMHISDESVLAICRLGRYLHYLHLGHCQRITDCSIIQLARYCTRIRYLDLANCIQLTDRSVIELATLPKLKRIGLVKCVNITDQSIIALTSHTRMASSLERVHLSYCARLTVPAIMQLVNFCDKLTHLSLTQVPAFIRPDLQRFRRTPPAEFTEQQRKVFCVFSGRGVRDLRTYFNNITAAQYEDVLAERRMREHQRANTLDTQLHHPITFPIAPIQDPLVDNDTEDISL